MDKETKPTQDPAIIAKHLDDWLFEEYEEPLDQEADPWTPILLLHQTVCRPEQNSINFGFVTPERQAKIWIFGASQKTKLTKKLKQLILKPQ